MMQLLFTGRLAQKLWETALRRGGASLKYPAGINGHPCRFVTRDTFVESSWKQFLGHTPPHEDFFGIG